MSTAQLENLKKQILIDLLTDSESKIDILSNCIDALDYFDILDYDIQLAENNNVMPVTIEISYLHELLTDMSYMGYINLNNKKYCKVLSEFGLNEGHLFKNDNNECIIFNY